LHTFTSPGEACLTCSCVFSETSSFCPCCVFSTLTLSKSWIQARYFS